MIALFAPIEALSRKNAPGLLQNPGIYSQLVKTVALLSW
jgi:hypothetical protein